MASRRPAASRRPLAAASAGASAPAGGAQPGRAAAPQLDDAWQALARARLDARCALLQVQFGALQRWRELQAASAGRAAEACAEARETPGLQAPLALGQALLAEGLQHGRECAALWLAAAGDIGRQWTEGLAQWQQASSGAGARWLDWQSLAAGRPEVAQAEVEHLASPLTASPWWVPVQEATLQAMTLASSWPQTSQPSPTRH